MQRWYDTATHGRGAVVHGPRCCGGGIGEVVVSGYPPAVLPVKEEEYSYQQATVTKRMMHDDAVVKVACVVVPRRLVPRRLPAIRNDAKRRASNAP
eukprot:scaffold7112_cov155-Amphora_coffeaeformis.AAC.3